MRYTRMCLQDKVQQYIDLTFQDLGLTFIFILILPYKQKSKDGLVQEQNSSGHNP